MDVAQRVHASAAAPHTIGGCFFVRRFARRKCCASLRLVVHVRQFLQPCDHNFLGITRIWSCHEVSAESSMVVRCRRDKRRSGYQLGSVTSAQHLLARLDHAAKTASSQLSAHPGKPCCRCQPALAKHHALHRASAPAPCKSENFRNDHLQVHGQLAHAVIMAAR